MIFCNHGVIDIYILYSKVLTKSDFGLELDPELGLEQVEAADGADDAVRVLQDRVAPDLDLELVWNVALKTTILRVI